LMRSSDFLANFSGSLSVMLYLLIPWTAVNLADFYLVRKGRYSITDILEPDGGLYGHWNRKGMAAYVVGFVAMIPFFSTVIFTGPIAQAIDGADIAPIIGLAVSAGAYLIFMRKNNLAAEMAIVATRGTTSVPSQGRSPSTEAGDRPLFVRDAQPDA
jgi:NCS1 family nucleobase:cation symporter-1